MSINTEYYFQKGRRRGFPLSLAYTSSKYYFSFSVLLLKQTSWGQQGDFFLDEVVSQESQQDFLVKLTNIFFTFHA